MRNPARIAAAAAVARASVVATDSAMQRYAMRAVDPDTSDEEVDVFQTCRGCSGTGTMKLRRRAGGVNTIQCPGCNGVWLDFGELATLRAQFASTAERAAATEQFLKDRFDKQFDALRRHHREESAAFDGIARALRFICPSSLLGRR